MIIYASILILSLVCFLFEINNYRTVELSENLTVRRSKLIFPLIILATVCFFAGYRGEMADTGAYIHAYYDAPNDFSEFFNYVKELKSEQLFYGYMCFIRCLFPNAKSTFWLMSIAVISALLILKGLYNNAECSSFVLFVFIASAEVMWFMNGMRQLLAVSIIFSASNLLEKRKWIRFIIVIVIAYFVHDSALLMIPFYMITLLKPWSKSIWIFIIISMVVVMNGDVFFNTMDTVMSDSSFSDNFDLIKNDTGSNIFRVFVSAVPIVIAYIKRKEIAKLATPYINICINMSLLTAIIYLLATFTSGIIVGRVPLYFELFSFVLLQWILSNVFDKDKKVLMYILCIFFYIIYFYYGYNGIHYRSHILNIKA